MALRGHDLHVMNPGVVQKNFCRLRSRKATSRSDFRVFAEGRTNQQAGTAGNDHAGDQNEQNIRGVKEEHAGIPDVGRRNVVGPLEQYSMIRGGFWFAGAMDDGLPHFRRGHESASYAVIGNHAAIS
jgi:hypothetical protein